MKSSEHVTPASCSIVATVTFYKYFRPCCFLFVIHAEHISQKRFNSKSLHIHCRRIPVLIEFHLKSLYIMHDGIQLCVCDMMDMATIDFRSIYLYIFIGMCVFNVHKR